jgi:hypothetical protein
MVTYDFHPDVRVDLDEIWQFIAADSPDAADRLMAAGISGRIRKSAPCCQCDSVVPDGIVCGPGTG